MGGQYFATLKNNVLGRGVEFFSDQWMAPWYNHEILFIHKNFSFPPDQFPLYLPVGTVRYKRKARKKPWREYYGRVLKTKK